LAGLLEMALEMEDQVGNRGAGSPSTALSSWPLVTGAVA